MLFSTKSNLTDEACAVKDIPAIRSGLKILFQHHRRRLGSPDIHDAEPACAILRQNVRPDVVATVRPQTDHFNEGGSVLTPEILIRPLFE
jgi:hypothetical protein